MKKSNISEYRRIRSNMLRIVNRAGGSYGVNIPKPAKEVKRLSRELESAFKSYAKLKEQAVRARIVRAAQKRVAGISEELRKKGYTVPDISFDANKPITKKQADRASKIDEVYIKKHSKITKGTVSIKNDKLKVTFKRVSATDVKRQGLTVSSGIAYKSLGFMLYDDFPARVKAWPHDGGSWLYIRVGSHGWEGADLDEVQLGIYADPPKGLIGSDDHSDKDFFEACGIRYDNEKDDSDTVNRDKFAESGMGSFNFGEYVDEW